MFKATNIISILFFTALLLLIPVRDISATVGGPTYIERLSYSPNENALYYLINDQGGRGCPPEIEKMNLAAKERTLVMSCDKIEATYYTDESFNSADYDQFIQDTFKILTTLPIISLPKNDISVAVEYVGEHRFDEYNVSSDFRAAIFQNGQKKGTIDFIGCYKDQPNVFRGYLIPNTNKMAMEISRIGDCFEGGYTKDDVYILDDINFQDTNPVGYYNYSSEPGVHQGDLVISARDNAVTDIPSEATKKNNLIFVWGILALIVSFVVGYIVGQKKKAKPSQDFAASARGGSAFGGKEQNQL